MLSSISLRSPSIDNQFLLDKGISVCLIRMNNLFLSKKRWTGIDYLTKASNHICLLIMLSLIHLSPLAKTSKKTFFLNWFKKDVCKNSMLTTIYWTLRSMSLVSCLCLKFTTNKTLMSKTFIRNQLLSKHLTKAEIRVKALSSKE